MDTPQMALPEENLHNVFKAYRRYLKQGARIAQASGNAPPCPAPARAPASRPWWGTCCAAVQFALQCVGSCRPSS